MESVKRWRSSKMCIRDRHNLDSNCHNVVFREKQMVETAGTKIVDRNQTDGDDSTDETTGAAVFFSKIRIPGT